ncbi:hypothetical protein F5B22DRAFT_544396 [Xylaria bambusicola]|uniref:uncharacterized protein n=1 Tax=Xylaria bambusicola TaxID=326684 RepID=UPI002008A317|nr:uncharacterized protein F5B22DRAFT_544396 [Xylaria bambusicola]KAI0521595.1 hypothetical protein F5B22DRAFT_544396 [Xylaria bambusicola]
MGNTPSTEAPRKGFRTTQKLSKPRIGNPAAAGLLNQTGVSDIIRRPPSTPGRRLSLPHSSTPVPSPRSFEPENTTVDDSVVPHGDPALAEDFSSRPFPQSDSQGAVCQRVPSAGAVASSSRDRGMSRTSSGYMGTDESYEQAMDLAGIPRTTPSLNHGLSAYEPQRMLNHVEAPPFEDQSIISEPQFQGAISRRQSYTTPYPPTHVDAAMALPRTSSDVSLYTPMRRRSFMTPGVATRPAPADSTLPLSLQISFNPPLTPSRSDLAEHVGAGFPSLPPPSFDPSLIPRVETPCETEYKQTGAFKHGTLRITNGSPARTPARETADDGLLGNNSPAAIGHGSYFDARSEVEDGQNEKSDAVFSLTSASKSVNVTRERESAVDFLPKLELSLSSLSISEFRLGVPELQTTSRQSAVEDELFEDTAPEYSVEILNVRLDHDAKQPPRPPTGSEDKTLQDISRSDSGVVASPLSTAPHKTLSKADSGYSSSVSTHSSSLKRDEPPRTSHSHYVKEVPVQAQSFDSVSLPRNISTSNGLNTVNPHKEQPQPSSPDGPPPRVPEKDAYTRVSKQIPARKPVQPPTTSSVNHTLLPSHQSAPGANPMATSSPSTSGAPHSGRLHRFLSGSRKPLAVPAAQTSDMDVRIPPVPRDLQVKMHERPGTVLNPPDNSTSTAANTTVQNQDHHSDTQASQTDGSSAQKGQDKMRSRKSSFHIHSISSTISRAASSVIAKNPILRKPLLSKAKPDDEDAVAMTPSAPAPTPGHDETSQWEQGRLKDINPSSSSSRREAGRRDISATANGRSYSLSVSAGIDSRPYDHARHSSLPSQSEQHATAFRQPSFTGQYPVSRTPPVSLAMRNMGQLRVPPPIRPRSTPAKPVAPTLSHKSSRGGVQSYPPYNHPMNTNRASSSRRSSQESFYNYTATQIQGQGHPKQPSQMPSTMQWSVPVQPGEYQWPLIATPNYGAATSQEPSFDHSRHSSLTSQTSHRSAFGNGPSYISYNAPSLKHRSSYEGYSLPMRQTYGLENGSYPTLTQMNGQLYTAGHPSGQPIVYQAGQFQQHPRYSSRGHHRHYSLDQYGRPVQYRVLHSYNSPAYRGVPIWSA